MRAVNCTARPTQRDALHALALLYNELLAEFPFVDNTARSVAMSMLQTPVLRAAMAVAPMHVVTAPEAGTGKSYLADIASAIAVGDRCAVMAVSDKAEETEKRLIGAALAQFPIIALDNVSTLLWGDFLCQATERAQMQIRPLGTSDAGAHRQHLHLLRQRQQPGDRRRRGAPLHPMRARRRHGDTGGTHLQRRSGEAHPRGPRPIHPRLPDQHHARIAQAAPPRACRTR